MSVRPRRIAMIGTVALLFLAIYRVYFVTPEDTIKNTILINSDVLSEDAAAKVEQLAEKPRSNGSEVHYGRIDETTNGDLVGVARVEFPNGVSVDINLLQYVPEEPTVPSYGPLKDVYDGLAAAAEKGDGAAGRRLYRGLRSCIGRFADSENMEASINELRRTGRIKYPGGTIEEIGFGPQALGTEDVIREQYQNCSGVTQVQIESRDDWLKLAVDAGDFLAMRDYARFVLGTKTTEGFELYKKTWENGHISSASAMAIFYRDGTPAELNGEPDMLYSYAFTLISNSVKKSVGRIGSDAGEPSIPLSANRLYSMDQLLSRKGAYLTPSQVEEAEHLAIGILINNDACCLGNWLSRR